MVGERRTGQQALIGQSIQSVTAASGVNTLDETEHDAHAGHGENERCPAMQGEPGLQTEAVRLGVEAAVRAVIAGYGLIEIVAATSRQRLVRVLAIVGAAAEYAIEQAGQDARAEDGLHRG